MNNEFTSYPNQKRILLHKELSDNKDPNNYYAKINLRALRNAMHNLTPKAFELWIYFDKNKADNTKPFWLSKEDFMNWSTVKKTSFYEAMKELEEKNYLIPRDERKSVFDFYEMPKEKDDYIVFINKF